MIGILQTPWGRQVIAAFGIGVILAVIGPLGTFRDLDLPARLLYWVAMVVLGWGQWILLDRTVGKLALLGFGAWPGPWWGREAVLCIVTPVPMIFEIVGVRALFGLSTGISWAELYLWTAGITVLICLLVVGVIYWARTANEAPRTVTPVAGDEARDQQFLHRLPAEKRGRLLCLKTEDHYLRVYTESGEELILLRLKDALRELEGHDGRQVHRSYWVSRAAVTEAKRAGRRTRLVLANGLEVPVSETYLPELRLAGWLD